MENLPEEENKVESKVDEIKEDVKEFFGDVKDEFKKIEEEVVGFFEKQQTESVNNTIATPITAEDTGTVFEKTEAERLADNLTNLTEASDPNHDSASANGGQITPIVVDGGSGGASPVDAVESGEAQEFKAVDEPPIETVESPIVISEPTSNEEEVVQPTPEISTVDASTAITPELSEDKVVEEAPIPTSQEPVVTETSPETTESAPLSDEDKKDEASFNNEGQSPSQA